MKTLEYCKRMVAYNVAHPDWDAVMVSLKQIDPRAMDFIVTSVSEMYAEACAELMRENIIAKLNEELAIFNGLSPDLEKSVRSITTVTP
jgi:hypothetical protein